MSKLPPDRYTVAAQVFCPLLDGQQIDFFLSNAGGQPCTNAVFLQGKIIG